MLDDIKWVFFIFKYLVLYHDMCLWIWYKHIFIVLIYFHIYLTYTCMQYIFGASKNICKPYSFYLEKEKINEWIRSNV